MVKRLGIKRASRPLRVGRQTQIIATQDSTWVQRKALLVDMTSVIVLVWDNKEEGVNYKSCLLERPLKRGLELSSS